MAANTIPTVSTLPPAPTRADAPADFTTKADTFVAALPKLVTQVNLTVSGMNDQASYLDQLKTDVNGYKNAAAQSATDAGTQAGNAKTYADSAKAYRDSAQAIAAALGSQAALPAFAGHGGDFLGVTLDEKSVDYFPGVQSGYQEFTSSGIFSKPTKAKWIYVELLSGGSSGSLSINSGNNTRHVQGGLGGDFNYKLIRASDLPSNISVSVGNGGTPVVRTVQSGETTVQGNPGGDSSFGSVVKSLGAKAPPLPSTTPFTNARDGDFRGGISATNTSAAVMATLVGSSIKGGAPGACAATSAGTVANGVPGTSQDLGIGGAVGQAGPTPGSGGGAIVSVATSGTFSSGAGAGGFVRIWWW